MPATVTLMAQVRIENITFGAVYVIRTVKNFFKSYMWPFLGLDCATLYCSLRVDQKFKNAINKLKTKLTAVK